MLNHIITEPVCEHLTRQRGNSDARTLALEDITEILKVGVSAAHNRVLELEGGDVGAADDLVGSVHVSGCAVGLGVADLVLSVGMYWARDTWMCIFERNGTVREVRAYFDFEEVLRRSVDLLEGLVPTLWNVLHCGGGSGGG